MQSQGSDGLSDLEGWDPRRDAHSNKQFNSYTKGLGKAYSSRDQGSQEIKLFVKGIPTELSTEGLKNLFLEHGDVLSVKKCVNTRFPDQGHTFGFVSYRTTREALAAVQKLDGFQITKKFHLRVRPAITDEERRKQKEERQEEEAFLNSLPSSQVNGVAGSDDSSKENKVSGAGVKDLGTHSTSSKDTGLCKSTNPDVKAAVLTDQNIATNPDPGMPKPTPEKHRVTVIERLAASARQCEQQPLSVDMPALAKVMERKPGVTGPPETRGLGRGLLAVNSSQFGAHIQKFPGGMVGSHSMVGEGEAAMSDYRPSYQQCESLKITVNCGIGARQVEPTQDKVAVPSVPKHTELSPSGRGRSFYDSPEHFNGDRFSPTANFSGSGYGRGQYGPRHFQANSGYPPNRPKMPFSPRGRSPVNQAHWMNHNLGGPGHQQRPRDFEAANHSISSRHSDSGSDKSRKSQCKFCGKPGKCKCTICKTPYCGQQCQREDWKTHKFECKPISSPTSDSNPKEGDLFQGFEVSVDEDFVKAIQKQYKNVPADLFPPMPLSTVSPRTSTARSSPVASIAETPIPQNLPVTTTVTQNTAVACHARIPPVSQNTTVAGKVVTPVLQNPPVVERQATQTTPVTGSLGAPVIPKTPVAVSVPEPVLQNSPKTIPKGHLAPNSPIQGFVSWMTSPTDLWVCTVADMDKYEQLTLQLTQSYSDSGDNTSYIPSKGDYCAAFYVTFSTWNRGLVQQVDNNTATVLFVDYGNSEVLATKFLRKLLPQFYDLPAQAYPCSLKGFTENPALKWSEKSCSLMKEVIAESTPYMLKAGQCVNGVHVIEVFTMESPDGSPLNERLKLAGCPVSEMPKKRLFLADSLSTVCDEIKQGDSISIAVCQVTNPCQFKVHLCDPQHVQQFLKFNQQLNTFYDSLPPQPYPCTTVGELVIAKFSADNKWYRAKVLQINKNDVDLLFIDFGNLESRTAEYIRAAGAKCESFLVQAVNCGLDGILPIKGDKWCEEVVQLFQTLPGNLTAKVLSKTGVKLNLEIYEDENSTLSSYIVKQGLAKFSDPNRPVPQSQPTRPVPQSQATRPVPQSQPTGAVPQSQPQKPGPHSQSLTGSVPQTQPQRPGPSENSVPLASPQQTSAVQPSMKSQSNNFLPTRLKVGCPTLTLCPVVNHDGTVYLQSLDEENQNTLAKIVTVDEVYQSRKVVLFQPLLNQKVCAQFTGIWSRGIVEDVLADGTLKIFFVDYGNSEILPSNVVQPLDGVFTDIPAQGIQCRLNGSETVNWSEAMTAKLKEIICEQAPTATLFKEQNGCSFVDLVLADVNVNWVILALGTSKVEHPVCPPLKPDQSLKPPLKIPHVKLTVGATTLGQCTVVSEDGTFFVQIFDANITNLEKLDQINVAYQRKEPTSSRLEKGHNVCAKYKDYWCRGTVEDVFTDGSVKVFFIDYGNMETLPSSFVQPLEGFLEIPAQAIKCRLNGCEKVPWSKDTNSKLNGLIFEKALTVTLMEELNRCSSVNVEVEGTSVNAAILASVVPTLTQPVAAPVPVLKKKILPLSLCKGQFTPGQCWTVTDNGTFYVQMITAENISNLEQLDHIHVAYQGRPCVPAVLGKGQYVCAKYKEFWCRGSIEDILTNGSVKVFFVDYGNTETLPSNCVQPLDDQFLTIPAQGIKCVLKGNDSITWSSQLTDKLKELIFNKVSNLTLVKELKGCSVVNVEIEGTNVNSAILGSLNSQIAQTVSPVSTTPLMNSVGMATSNMASLSLQSAETGLPCVKLTAGKSLPVSCVLVEPDGSFFIQDISAGNRETLLTLFKMDEIYQERPITILVPYKPIRGQLACAKFLDSWSRARIKSIQADGSVEVFFVDYGNVEIVPCKSAQELDDEYATIPAQAIRCVLDGYERVKWSPQLAQKLSELILNQTAVVSLVREVDGCNFVKLHLQETGVDVNAALLAESQTSNVSHEPVKASQSQTSRNVATLKDLGVPSLLPGKEADLVLMTILSPAEFYCVKSDAEAITQALHESCESLPYDESYSPAVQELCCARFVLDNRWYRAVVTDKEETSGQYEVMYIDYGNEAILEEHNVRRPPQPFSKPPCAIRCSLPGVSSAPDCLWSPQSIEIIQGCSEQLVHIEILRALEGRHEVKLIHNGRDVGEKLRRLCGEVKTNIPNAGGDAASTNIGQDTEVSQAESLRRQNEELRKQLMQLQALVSQQAANKG